MALALPGARGLFSHLQHAIKSRIGQRLRLTPAFHQALHDFRWIHDTLAHRPTRLYELVPTSPTLSGTHDASGTGAGGVWFPDASAVPRSRTLHTVNQASGHTLQAVRPKTPVPVVWRFPFPSHVSDQLISFTNPSGSINNSELELLGAYLHDDVAAHCWDVRERTLRSATDNLATLFWYRRGSVTTTSPTATLLRQHAIHQRYHRYVSLKDYIPGPSNALADAASRLWHLSDLAFLSHFNTHYPQDQPWHLYRHPRSMTSSGISALRTRMSPLASFLRAPRPLQPTGASGKPSATPSISLLPYKASLTRSPTSRSLRFATETESSIPLGAMSAAAPWKVPFAALAKRSRVWGPRTPVSLPKAPLTLG